MVLPAQEGGSVKATENPPPPATTEEECYDCHHVFTENEEQFEDTMKNPQCESCHDKLREKAEALLAEPEEDECRFCGAEFIPEEKGQRFCSEDCEYRDRKIDEAEAKREEREDR